MDDDQLTKLAVEELIKEGKKFAKKRELSYTFDEPTRMRPNLRYFKNTLHSCISSNNREEKERKSSAAEKMQLLRKKQVNKTDNKATGSKDSFNKSYKERNNEKKTSKTKEIAFGKRKSSEFKKDTNRVYKHGIASTSKEDQK